MPERCVANIGPRERRKRLLIGMASWAIAALGLALLLETDAQRFWRLLLFLPLWGGAIGFFQHREKT